MSVFYYIVENLKNDGKRGEKVEIKTKIF